MRNTIANVWMVFATATWQCRGILSASKTKAWHVQNRLALFTACCYIDF